MATSSPDPASLLSLSTNRRCFAVSRPCVGTWPDGWLDRAEADHPHHLLRYLPPRPPCRSASLPHRGEIQACSSSAGNSAHRGQSDWTEASHVSPLVVLCLHGHRHQHPHLHDHNRRVLDQVPHGWCVHHEHGKHE